MFSPVVSIKLPKLNNCSRFCINDDHDTLRCLVSCYKALRKKCPYSELFWSAFSKALKFNMKRVSNLFSNMFLLSDPDLFTVKIPYENVALREKCPNTEFFLVRKSPYSVRIHENTD